VLKARDCLGVLGLRRIRRGESRDAIRVLHTSDGLDSTQVENKRVYLGVRGLTVQYPDGMRAGIRMAAIRSELDPPCAKIGSNIAC